MQYTLEGAYSRAFIYNYYSLIISTSQATECSCYKVHFYKVLTQNNLDVPFTLQGARAGAYIPHSDPACSCTFIYIFYNKS